MLQPRQVEHLSPSSSSSAPAAPPAAAGMARTREAIDESQLSEVANVQTEVALVQDQIDAVAKSIKAVELQIENAGWKVEEAEKEGNREDLVYWREEKNKLREEKIKLREEKIKLREEKIWLGQETQQQQGQLSEVANVQTEVFLVQDQIDAVAKNIKAVELQIENAGWKVEEAEKEGNREDLVYWREEKNKLREEKNKLREEKFKLLDKENKLREEKNKLREEKIKLLDKEIWLRQQTQQQHGLLPGVQKQDIVELLDELRLDLRAQNQRATPSKTPAHLGGDELKEIRDSNRFTTFKEKAGQQACLNAVEFDRLALYHSESEVVAFLTPILGRIFQEKNLVVVNSEENSWLKVSRDTNIYNQKPDLLVCHGAIYKKCPPSKTTEATDRLRRPDFKFGALSDWRLRDCISVILEAKTKITNAAFGEVINYGRHVSSNHPEPKDVRIVLFDKSKFWLVTFAKGICAYVTECGWMVHGSKQLLAEFAKRSDWLEVLDSVCNSMDLVVDEGSAFLGQGSFGRVFRVFRCQGGGQGKGDELALKIVCGNDNSLDLLMESRFLKQALDLVPDHVVGMEDFQMVQENKGAGLLLCCVGRPIAEKAEYPLVIEALAALHASKIYHGDARLDNAVFAAHKVKFIDFRGAQFPPFPTSLHFCRDMRTLVCSILPGPSLPSSVKKAVENYGESVISVQELIKEVSLFL